MYKHSHVKQWPRVAGKRKRKVFKVQFICKRYTGQDARKASAEINVALSQGFCTVHLTATLR